MVFGFAVYHRLNTLHVRPVKELLVGRGPADPMYVPDHGWTGNLDPTGFNPQAPSCADDCVPRCARCVHEAQCAEVL